MDTVTSYQDKDIPYEEVLENKRYGTDMNYKLKYVWRVALVHMLLQIGWVIGIYTAIFQAQYATILWAIVVRYFAFIGIIVGAHRYFTHKAFKATPLLKVILVIAQTMAGQNSMFTWVRDHVIHHKFTDTDADPHNSNRGFFYSHMGWLVTKKQPLKRQKEREMDWSELKSDKLIMFQHDYFFYLYFLLAVIFPVAVPVYFWNESLWNSFLVAYVLQYVTNLHITWSVNSVAHIWGSKPYDKRTRAVESMITTILTNGEGTHNYHHAFPRDYRLSDKHSNLGKTAIDILAYLGLAYDLKITTPSVVQGHIKRHGNTADQNTFVDTISSQEEQQKDAVRAM